MRNIIYARHFERRIKTRYQPYRLQVQASLRGFFGRKRANCTVTCLDFNRYGMAFASQERFKAGDKLSFHFQGRYISEKDVVGVITSCSDEPCEDGQECYRYGVRFQYCLSSKSYCKATDNALSRIEGLFRETGDESVYHPGF